MLVSILMFFGISSVSAQEFGGGETSIIPFGAPKPYNGSENKYYSYSDGVGSYSINFTLSGNYEVCKNSTGSYYVCNYSFSSTSGVTEHGPEDHAAYTTNTTHSYSASGSSLYVTVTSHVRERHYSNYYNVQHTHTFKIN